MSKEKQIDEMAQVLEDTCDKVECKFPYDCDSCHAKILYNAGYRKHSVGEWKYLDGDVGYDIYGCSVCGESVVFYEEDKYAFCPNCGAKMKGGAE